VSNTCPIEKRAERGQIERELTSSMRPRSRERRREHREGRSRESLPPRRDHYDTTTRLDHLHERELTTTRLDYHCDGTTTTTRPWQQHHNLYTKFRELYDHHHNTTQPVKRNISEMHIRFREIRFWGTCGQLISPIKELLMKPTRSFFWSALSSSLI